MANDCTFHARITGSPENIKKLNDALELEGGLLNYNNWNIIFDQPISEDFNWGTKWMQYELLDYCDGDDILLTSGSSAWAPAEGFWEKLSTEYDLDVYLEYEERGNDFGGILNWKSGQLILDNEMSWWEYFYEMQNDTFWEEINFEIEQNSLEEIWEMLDNVGLNEEDKLKIIELYKEYHDAN